MKRLVAIPGDKVTFRGDAVWVNGQRAYDSSLEGGKDLGVPQTIGTGISLGSDQYVVLGDNRERSTDSRTFGPVTREAIFGHVWLRLGRDGLQLLAWPW